MAFNNLGKIFKDATFFVKGESQFFCWLILFLPPLQIYDGANSLPVPAAEVVVDFGAAAGGEGSFGWYSEHPVQLA